LGNVMGLMSAILSRNLTEKGRDDRLDREIEGCGEQDRDRLDTKMKAV